MVSELERRLSSLKQGDHACLIYENTAEQLAAAVPFIKEGLGRGERCVYVADDRTDVEILQALEAAGVDTAEATRRGALVFLTKREAYLRSGEFSPQPMIEFLRQAEDKAIAEGFSGLRYTGEVTWALGPEAGNDRLIEYEALLSYLPANARSVLLCQYNRSRMGAPCIFDVLRTHRIAVLGDQVCSNRYYEPPGLVLEAGPETQASLMAKRVDWWIKQLKEVEIASREREQLFGRMQVLSRRLLEVQEAERGHLARELHDEIGQLLTGLRFLLKAEGDSGSDLDRSKLEQAGTIVEELVETVRGLSFDLRPAALDQPGLLSALHALFERYTKQTGVQVNYSHAGLGERFDSVMETAAYRIVQEALTNVARHAQVKEATVRLWVHARTLEIQVEDQGVGFDPRRVLSSGRSHGLLGMRERVQLLGGRLDIDSTEGIGTHLLAELPLARPTSEIRSEFQE